MTVLMKNSSDVTRHNGPLAKVMSPQRHTNVWSKVEQQRFCLYIYKEELVVKTKQTKPTKKNLTETQNTERWGFSRCFGLFLSKPREDLLFLIVVFMCIFWLFLQYLDLAQNTYVSERNWRAEPLIRIRFYLQTAVCKWDYEKPLKNTVQFISGLICSQIITV